MQTEIIVIGIILFIVLGSKKTAKFARGLGESSKEIKKTKKEFDEAFNEVSEGIKEDKKGPTSKKAK